MSPSLPLLLLVACAPQERAERPPPVGEDTFRFVKLLDFTMVTDMVALPDGHVLVADLGRCVLSLVDPVAPAIVDELDFPEQCFEMLSLALDPLHGDNRFLYTYGGHGISRYTLQVRPFRLSVRKEIYNPGCGTDELKCHGDMTWWDGEAGEPVLYVATNQGPGTDHQDAWNLGSKLLALRVDPDSGEVSPAFSSSDGDDYVVATGLRNPWRVTPCGSVLCLVDPGDSAFEELNLYAQAGMNFGWPLAEGDSGGLYDDPVATWGDAAVDWLQEDPTGRGAPGVGNTPGLGLRASAEAYGGRLDGVVLFTDLFDGWVRGLKIGDDGEPEGGSWQVAHQGFLTSMVEVGGYVYAADLVGGFYRMELWESRPRLPQGWLSQTHFEDATPFGVRHALWSNGADKQRALWLPDGASVDTSGEHWAFPEGTEVFKTFSVAGRPVETRLISLVGGQWLGTSYIWEGEDARCYDGERQVVTAADGSDYTVPGETTCDECHDATRGRAWPLSLDPFLLGNEGLAQVAGLLDSPPAAAPEVPGGPLERSARGYLQANCAFCHNIEGMTGRIGMEFDLSYDAEEMNLTDLYSRYLSDAQRRRVVVPDAPSESVLTQTMETTQMPKVGVWVKDDEGIALLNAWISTL